VFSDVVAGVAFLYAIATYKKWGESLQPVKEFFSCSGVYILEFVVSLQVISDTSNIL
jgi:hypothetical protein